MPIHIGDFNTGLENMRKTIRNLPLQLAAEAESFFKSNFDVQGWQGDNGVKPWPNRKYDRSTRLILIGKGTAHLKKGLRKFVTGKNIGVNVTGIAAKYADAHNFGETINVPVTTKLRKWAWAMFYKTKLPMYKAIALTRKSMMTIKMPERKFIGNSKMLDARLYGLIERKLTETKV